MAPLPFLGVFPQEIRDQIYTQVLANPTTGIVSLRPWTIEVERSLLLLRTCKQIHRECKEIIWLHNEMTLRDDCQLFGRLCEFRKDLESSMAYNLIVTLEVLDYDELAWACRALHAFVDLSGSITSIDITTVHDRPRSVRELEDVLNMHLLGETLDGRKCVLEIQPLSHGLQTISIYTGWPAFSHWGKHRWVKEMLLDNRDPSELLEGLHTDFGGTIVVDRQRTYSTHSKEQYYSDVGHQNLAESMRVDPRNGTISLYPSMSRQI